MTAVAAPRSTIRFVVDGRPVHADVPGGARLLDILRGDLGLTGTKEGCGEGECGACSVILDGEVVASCLVPMSQVHGSRVLTAEGLATDGRLDPLQRAFADSGAVQCGFCTPGLLMAARAWLDRGAAATEDAVRQSIAGNLCRCTGYTKVVDAVLAVAEHRGGDGAAWGPATLAPAGGAGPRRIAHRREASEALVPESLDEALGLLRDRPGLRPIAGGTDVMVELAAATARDAALLDIWRLDELRGIRVEADELVVGALTTFAGLCSSPVVAERLPVLAEMAASVGAAQIQARGTIGGNVMTASPAGDALPVLLATDATLEVAGAAGTRKVAAASFWPAYRRTALRPGELLVAARFPLVPARTVRYRKLGTRQAQAISKVVIAVAWRDGGAGSRPSGPSRWRDVRVALGSVAPTPIRAPRTEALLEGGVPAAGLAGAAASVVRTEISPIDDVRSTAAYRREVTGRMLRRIVLEAAEGAAG